jgi:hypothetical protein
LNIRQKELEELTKKVALLQKLGNLQDKTQYLSEQSSTLRATLEALNKIICDKTQELQVCIFKKIFDWIAKFKQRLIYSYHPRHILGTIAIDR